MTTKLTRVEVQTVKVNIVRKLDTIREITHNNKRQSSIDLRKILDRNVLLIQANSVMKSEARKELN